MEAVKQANAGTDAAAIQRALDQLTQAQHKAAESLYKQQAPGGAGPSAGPGQADGGDSSSSGGSGKAPTGDVIDAEVVDEGKA
jgi:molecular chaperone DnaK